MTSNGSNNIVDTQGNIHTTIPSNVVSKNGLRNNSKQTKSKKTESLKWMKSIRALPTNPPNNDYLRTEYIDVNLNNSRKLIGNLNDLNDTTTQSVQYNHEINESLARINNVKHELEWLNDL